jgi:hypothetical protein
MRGSINLIFGNEYQKCEKIRAGNRALRKLQKKKTRKFSWRKNKSKDLASPCTQGRVC